MPQKGKKIFHLVLQSVKKYDIITLQSIEMTGVLCARFIKFFEGGTVWHKVQ